MRIQPVNKYAEDQTAETGLSEREDLTCSSESGRMRPVPTMACSPIEQPAHVSTEASDEASKLAEEKHSSKRSHGAFELKFLIPEERVADIMVWARQHLDADPHFDPELGDGYLVNSLYLDTPNLDVFHRMEGFRQQKYRLRRYGKETSVWFEQKKKRKGLVRKKRVAVNEPEIASKVQLPSDHEWDGQWFSRKLEQQQLRPVCQITYRRFARVKPTDEGHLRLTIDDRLTARLADGWQVPAGPLDGIALLPGKRILELKFRGAMPVLFRELIEQQQLQVTPFSKYRTSVEQCVPFNALVGGDTQGLANA